VIGNMGLRQRQLAFANRCVSCGVQHEGVVDIDMSLPLSRSCTRNALALARNRFGASGVSPIGCQRESGDANVARLRPIGDRRLVIKVLLQCNLTAHCRPGWSCPMARARGPGSGPVASLPMPSALIRGSSGRAVRSSRVGWLRTCGSDARCPPVRRVCGSGARIPACLSRA
jgi:ribosomal protein S14